MYYIIDLTKEQPSVIPNLQFTNEIDAIDWINNNGDATMYSIMSSL
jgi:hypothetical protein